MVIHLRRSEVIKIEGRKQEDARMDAGQTHVIPFAGSVVCAEQAAEVGKHAGVSGRD